MHHPIRVLFLCDGNADSSQMAEGLLRSMGGTDFDVHSAGISPRALDPMAVVAMKEINIDISGHSSTDINDYMDAQFDFIVMLNDRVKSNCLFYPRDSKIEEWQCSDPTLAHGDAEEKMAAFRQTRDEIAEKLRPWITGVRNRS